MALKFEATVEKEMIPIICSKTVKITLFIP